MTQKNDKKITLEERLKEIDSFQASRFRKQSQAVKEIAAEGIRRHLRHCARMDVLPSPAAVREILDDAQDGRRIYATTSEF